MNVKCECTGKSRVIYGSGADREFLPFFTVYIPVDDRSIGLARAVY